jgi:hypothetical protein
VYGKTITTRKRITSAVWALVLNAIFWIVIPYYVGVFLTGRVPDSALTIPTFVYEFGILFIILEVGAAFFQGKAISVPFVSGAAILSVIYVWLVTNGGNLTVTTSGIDITLGFQVLLYVLILPSIWAAIRAPLSYLVWRSSSAGHVSETPLPTSSS